MAEKNNDNNWSWSSWINAAKNKSTEVFEFVKKDLEEFGSAVKCEATNMVTTTSTVLEKTLKLDDSESTASTMKRSFSSFLGQMNTVLNPSPDDSDTEAVIITENSETVPLTKLQKAVYELQINQDTFLKDPEPSLNAQYQCWLEIISDQLTEERLKKHLTSSETLNKQFLELCPEHVTHDNFWKRYLFKKALLEDSIAHQEAMEKREQREKLLTAETLKWEQEDFATDINLTEEEQIKLLEEYENETKQKQKISEPSSPEKVKESPDQTDNEAKQEKIESDKNEGENNGLSKKVSSRGSLSSEVSGGTKSSSSSLDGEWECVNNDKNQM